MADRDPLAEEPRRPKLGLRPETLLSSLAVVLLVNVFQRSLGLGRSLLLCRWLDPAELGYWEMAYGFLMLASPLAVLGLPGSFGRYLEKYRQQGQLRLFLRRTAAWSFGLAGGLIAVLAWQRERLAHLVFGDASQANLALAMLACLAMVILLHFLEAVFAGLRMFRVVSAMHFSQSLGFATIALSLVAGWRPTALSVIAGYGFASLASSLGVLVWSALRLESTQDEGKRIAHRDFWAPLMRFAIWVWVTNLLTNVFSIVDRYMIVHLGVFTPAEAIVQVGNYHTSNVVPLLLISVANLIVGAMTPHLSHDWEAGLKRQVSDRVNLALKLITLVMLAGGVLVLLLCPLLFRYAFENKYAGGLAVLPWTLTACVWFSLLLVAQMYVWCAEKSGSATPPLAAGLAANVGLNFLLLPIWGLLGAVMATAISTLLALVAQVLVNRDLGMKIGRGTWLVLFAPLVLAGGIEVATIGTVVLLIIAVARGWVFSARERRQLLQALNQRAPSLSAKLGLKQVPIT